MFLPQPRIPFSTASLWSEKFNSPFKTWMKFYFHKASLTLFLGSAAIKNHLLHSECSHYMYGVTIYTIYDHLTQVHCFLLYEVCSSIFFNPSQQGRSSHSFSSFWGRHPPELRLMCYLQPTLEDGQHSQQTLFLQQNVGICTRSGLNSGYIKTSL